jgi:mannose-1-phosphate guanylyltransferase
MTVDRKKYCWQLRVVGNIEGHLSEKYSEKSNTSYIDIIESTLEILLLLLHLLHLPQVGWYINSNPIWSLVMLPCKEQSIQSNRKATNGFIVTFCIIPTKPETGYGYIERALR